MKTILVTGSTGYIGKQLIEFLVQQNQVDPSVKIFGLSRQGDSGAKGWHSFQGDLMLPALPELLQELQPDVIFHLAAAPPTASLEEQLRVDVLGTRHLMQSLVQTQIQPHVVVLGSSAEYGPQLDPVDEVASLKPDTEYGIAKIAQTQMALHYFQQYQIPVTVGRAFVVYGKNVQNTKLIASLASQIARYEKAFMDTPRIHVRNLQAERDFIHVHDLVTALVTLSEKGRPGNIYNIASNQAVSVQEVLDILLQYSRLRNVQIISEGGRAADFSQGRTNKIDIHTGWRPGVALEDGLREELEFWREHTSFLMPDHAYGPQMIGHP